MKLNVVLVAAATLLWVFTSSSVLADDAESSSDDSQTHTLKYKFLKGETIRTQVVHLATTETRIRGNTQTSKSRGVSTKIWRIVAVDKDAGTMTFEHLVTKVKMWQHASGHAEIRYDSDKDEKPPLRYEQTAKTIGKVISKVTIREDGEVVERKDHFKQFTFGLGQIVPPLPKGSVKLGHQWHFPTEISVSLPEGRTKRIKTRQQYTLNKVKNGVATIDVKTQVLTPLNDPRIEAQLMQQLTHGEIKFDVDAGRILSQRFDWDEESVGFSGADSIMEYLARFEEKLIEGDVEPDVEIELPKSAKKRDDDPVLRR